MSVYPWGEQFLGLVTVFRVERFQKSDPTRSQSSVDGPIDVQLTHSRDGKTWHRLKDRSPVIPNGPNPFDAGCILGVSSTPVVAGDEVWVYYTAITTKHGGALPEKRITIGRAAWPRDRFVSLDADEPEGIIETVLLESEGGRLLINADASEGSIRVEILDENGKPLPGYSTDESVPLSSNGLREPVTWKNHKTIPTGRPIRIRFRLNSAKLFSYWSKP